MGKMFPVGKGGGFLPTVIPVVGLSVLSFIKDLGLISIFVLFVLL